jgi:hypothetical protein
MALLTSLLVSHATVKRPISMDWTALEVLALNLRLCRGFLGFLAIGHAESLGRSAAGARSTHAIHAH